MLAPMGRFRGVAGPDSRIHAWVGARVALIPLLMSGAMWIACTPEAPPPPPPLEIPVVEVIQRDQPIVMEMVGQTSGSSDIPIRARVEGVLLGMHFTEGRSVEAGQLLYEIDPAPYESQVVEAQGGLSEARTNLARTRADLNRIRPLAEMKAVSQSDLDASVAYYEAAVGAMQSAEARVEQAQIQLGYTKIHSPIAGRIGISKARIGEFVGRMPNPVVLNFVSQIDPIRVRFSIDERTYMLLARRLQSVADDGVDPSDEHTGLELVLADGTVHPHPGRAVAADASVDPKTGTFTFEADFPNPERLVLAGQFARVRAVAEVRKGVVLVPSRSVSELQGINRVFVIGEDGTAQLRPVELGVTVGHLRIVESGLEPGEIVALEIMRLRPGMQIQPELVTLDEAGSMLSDDPDRDRPEIAIGEVRERDSAADAGAELEAEIQADERDDAVTESESEEAAETEADTDLREKAGA